MKLSEAMMLGSTTCKMIPYDLATCALGAACNAVGCQVQKHSRWGFISQTWPWTDGCREGADRDYCLEIAKKFDTFVAAGKMTLEQLVDWVESVEPSCGECNKFSCTCSPAPDEAKEEVLTCSPS